jgi:mRNA-degrading endonuclease RelE of RelBE toxin-antitoxin system
VIERHRVELSTAAQKDLKGYRHAAAAIFDALARLEFDPESGHSLTGDLAGVRSLDITVKGSGAFRAAYEIDDLEKVCVVVAIGPRERFYERLRRRLNG